MTSVTRVSLLTPSASTHRNQRSGKPGKSRYAQKVAAPVIARKVVPPVNLYLSTCCKAQASKSRMVQKDKDQVSVGKWRCGACGKRTPVTVSKFKDVELAPESVPVVV